MATKISTELQQMYEIPRELMTILEVGEDSEENDAVVAALVSQLENIAPAIRNYLAYLDDHASMMKKRALVFTESARRAEQFATQIKDAIKETMVTTGMMEIAPFKVTNAAPALETEQGATPPAEFCDVIPETYKLRTNDLKAALKDGKTFAGYSLRPVYTLRVKP